MSMKDLVLHKTLAAEFGVTTATIWNWRKYRGFPEPVKLGPRLLAWSRISVEDWVLSQNEASEHEINQEIHKS